MSVSELHKVCNLSYLKMCHIGACFCLVCSCCCDKKKKMANVTQGRKACFGSHFAGIQSIPARKAWQQAAWYHCGRVSWYSASFHTREAGNRVQAEAEPSYKAFRDLLPPIRPHPQSPIDFPPAED